MIHILPQIVELTIQGSLNILVLILLKKVIFNRWKDFKNTADKFPKSL